ncbi:MAG TPA: 3-dehydroquinate synthase [Acidisarcina sp.]
MPAILVKSSSAEYKVVVGEGLLQSLSRRIRKLSKGENRRIFVLTSPEIWALWSGPFLASFAGQQQPSILFLAPGEQHKRLAGLEQLAEQMAREGADRSSLLIAFGGGIVGDAGGFLAAIYMRGIDYIQVPSTFLAQVDSSVGGKTGVNLEAGKNLIGSFHHPLVVLADTTLLATLPDRELRAGLFESVKAGIIRDAKLFEFLERNAAAILTRDQKALGRVIAASIRMKAEVVAIDERESGLRMILNFGHTLGHAIEAATGYRVLLHGEAVGWGMLAATHLGLQRGTISEVEADRITDAIFAYGPLPAFRLTGSIKAGAERLLEAAGRDKKNRAGVRRFVLPTGIGSCVVVEDVADEELYSTAEWLLRAADGSAVMKAEEKTSAASDERTGRRAGE